VNAIGKRLLGIGAVVVLAAATATAAVAYWTTRGSGSGSITAETVASVTLSPGTATTDLYPGTSGDVAVSVANGNTYRAYIGSLVLNTGAGTNGVSVDGAHSGCDPAALSYTAQSNGGAGWFVAASATLDLDLANAVALDTTAASACQGATFTLYLAAAP
jgi:hypothetical protein